MKAFIKWTVVRSPSKDVGGHWTRGRTSLILLFDGEVIVNRSWGRDGLHGASRFDEHDQAGILTSGLQPCSRLPGRIGSSRPVAPGVRMPDTVAQPSPILTGFPDTRSHSKQKYTRLAIDISMDTATVAIKELSVFYGNPIELQGANAATEAGMRECGRSDPGTVSWFKKNAGHRNFGGRRLKTAIRLSEPARIEPRMIRAPVRWRTEPVTSARLCRTHPSRPGYSGSRRPWGRPEVRSPTECRSESPRRGCIR